MKEISLLLSIFLGTPGISITFERGYISKAKSIFYRNSCVGQKFAAEMNACLVVFNFYVSGMGVEIRSSEYHHF